MIIGKAADWNYIQYIILLLENDVKGLSWKWSALKPGGIRPVPRSGVSVATAPNGISYIFGGVLDTDEDEETLQGNFSNEIHTLDLTKNIWRPLELKVAKVKKEKKSLNKDEIMDNNDEVQSSSTVTTDGVFTMIVGQSSVSNCCSNQKSNVLVSINSPSPRMKSGLTVCKGNLYVYGGIVEDGNKQVTLADFYSLGKLNIFFYIVYA